MLTSAARVTRLFGVWGQVSAPSAGFSAISAFKISTAATTKPQNAENENRSHTVHLEVNLQSYAGDERVDGVVREKIAAPDRAHFADDCLAVGHVEQVNERLDFEAIVDHDPPSEAGMTRGLANMDTVSTRRRLSRRKSLSTQSKLTGTKPTPKKC